MIGASTRVIALLGDPVRHSLSPVMQNAAIRSAGLDGAYVALRCSGEDVPGLIRGLAHAGGGGNVTLPHKEVAARNVEVATDAVRQTGACNTFWLENGRVHGDNTDVEGFRGAVVALTGRSAEGMRVLLLGAGGAARGALAGLLADGVGKVLIWNRSPERAVNLVREMGGGVAGVAPEPDEGEMEPVDLVINATSLGLRDEDPLPYDPIRLPAGSACLDLVYRPGETAFVHRARELGCPAADGGEMLVRQGAAAFRRWWGVEAPLSVMRDAFEGARQSRSASDSP